MKNKDRAILAVEDNYRQAAHQRHLTDLANIMQTESGRRFIIDLLDTCRVFKDNWTPSAEIHKFEGMRRVGLLVLKDIEELGMKGLELYHTAQKEYIALQMEDSRRREVDIAKTIKEEE